MNEIKLLSIFAENKLGFLAEITQTLATANINILWFKIIDNSGDNFGLLRVLVNHRSKAIENLKANGFTVSSVPILAVYIEDIPGALAGIADILSKENINIRNGSGFIFKGKTVLLIETDDKEEAAKILTHSNYNLLNENELES